MTVHRYMNEFELNADFVVATVNADGALERAKDWVREHLTPQDVFDREQLVEWARLNGWTAPKEG